MRPPQFSAPPIGGLTIAVAVFFGGLWVLITIPLLAPLWILHKIDRWAQTARRG